jgi:hypothetical protein
MNFRLIFGAAMVLATVIVLAADLTAWGWAVVIITLLALFLWADFSIERRKTIELADRAQVARMAKRARPSSIVAAVESFQSSRTDPPSVRDASGGDV